MKKKPLEVDEVQNVVIGVRVPVMLDRESNRFFANYAGRRYEHEVCATVKALVRAAIEAAQKLAWIPVIEIERLMPFSAHQPENFIGFTLARYYIACATAGRIVKTNWYVDDGEDVPLSVYRQRAVAPERRANEANDMSFVETFTWDEERWGKFRLPYPYEGCLPADSAADWRDEQTYYVAYTPELWHALELLLERIEETRKKLDELLLTPAGHRLLAAWAAQLAPGSSVFGLLAAARTPADDATSERPGGGEA